jgi:putative CocE/NonD family hydrolase
VTGEPPSAPSVAGVRIERDVPMTLSDGTALVADVYAPEAAGDPVPVLLFRTPYGKGMADDATYQAPAWYVRHGFIVVVQDVRGRGASGGRFVPFIHEADDSAEAIAWAAQLPGSNGRVGMFGASYPGMLQLLAATRRPPALGAIAPAVATADLHAHWMYEGGALNLAFTAWWAVSLASVEAARAGRTDLVERLAGPLLDPGAWFTSTAPAELPPLAEAAPWYREWLAHPERDAYWDDRDALRRLGEIEVPTLHIAGWFDIFLAGGIDAFRRLRAIGRAEQHLLVGAWMHYPWGHRAWQLRSAPAAQGTVTVDRAQVAFFRRHLADDRDTERPAPVRYWPVYGDAWREAADWPPPGAVERSLHLDSDGAANGVGGDGRLIVEPAPVAHADLVSYLPSFAVPSIGGHSCCYPGRSPMGVADQAPVEEMAQVLVYTSAPLPAAMELAGDVRSELWVATDAPSADYVARLCVVDESGGSWNIAEGIQRVGVGGTSTAGPGGPFRVDVSLRSIAAHVAAGRRLRLHVTFGSAPQWSINPQTGASPEWTAPADGRAATHAVHHGPDHPSRLVITVAPG